MLVVFDLMKDDLVVEGPDQVSDASLEVVFSRGSSSDVIPLNAASVRIPEGLELVGSE